MKVVVTGAGGYVGRKLVELLSDHEVVAMDSVADRIPRLQHVRPLAGDLCDRSVLEAAVADGCDAVVHLATVPGGGAEQDPELAWRVNVNGTRELAACAAAAGQQPRFVLASSIAVFGSPFPATVDDGTSLMPKSLYGAHKALMEQWLATLSRRGDLDAISLRLSGVVARPRGPSGMKSAFLSDVFHALAAGEDFAMPVSRNATCWLSSLGTAASNLAHAIVAELDAAPATRAMTLPALWVRVTDLVAEIARQTGRDVRSVSYKPEAELEAAFGSQSPLTTRAALALGFVNDGDLATLVGRALAAL
jgi:nucleoside-diphosphate-sugar epimerase